MAKGTLLAPGRSRKKAGASCPASNGDQTTQGLKGDVLSRPLPEQMEWILSILKDPKCYVAIGGKIDRSAKAKKPLVEILSRYREICIVDVAKGDLKTVKGWFTRAKKPMQIKGSETADKGLGRAQGFGQIRERRKHSECITELLAGEMLDSLGGSDNAQVSLFEKVEWLLDKLDRGDVILAPKGAIGAPADNLAERTRRGLVEAYGSGIVGGLTQVVRRMHRDMSTGSSLIEFRKSTTGTDAELAYADLQFAKGAALDALCR